MLFLRVLAVIIFLSFLHIRIRATNKESPNTSNKSTASLSHHVSLRERKEKDKERKSNKDEVEVRDVMKSDKTSFEEPVIKPIERKRKIQDGYHSIDQRAIRMARSSKFLESAQCSTFEEAYQAAKQKITERKRADNQRAEIQRKALGIKGKDRHRKDRRTKEGQIGKMTVRFLREKNQIFNHQQARKKAEEWYQEQNTKRRQRDRELRKERQDAKRGNY